MNRDDPTVLNDFETQHELDEMRERQDEPEAESLEKIQVSAKPKTTMTDKKDGSDKENISR